MSDRKLWLVSQNYRWKITFKAEQLHYDSVQLKGAPITRKKIFKKYNYQILNEVDGCR